MRYDWETIEFVVANWRKLDLRSSFLVEEFLNGASLRRPGPNQAFIPVAELNDWALLRFGMTLSVSVGTVSWLVSRSSEESVGVFLDLLHKFRSVSHDGLDLSAISEGEQSVDSLEDLVSRMRGNPVLWIGRVCVHRLRAFLLGFELAGKQRLLPTFERYVACNYRLETLSPRWDHVLSTFHGGDAVQEFFILWARFLAEHP